MNQPTPVSPTLPASESTVVAAQMKARREELKRLLTSPNSPQAGGSGQSRDTYDPQHHERRGNAVGFGFILSICEQFDRLASMDPETCSTWTTSIRFCNSI